MKNVCFSYALSSISYLLPTHPAFKEALDFDCSYPESSSDQDTFHYHQYFRFPKMPFPSPASGFADSRLLIIPDCDEV
jgi:hypothetical protein